MKKLVSRILAGILLFVFFMHGDQLSASGTDSMEVDLGFWVGPWFPEFTERAKFDESRESLHIPLERTDIQHFAVGGPFRFVYKNALNFQIGASFHQQNGVIRYRSIGINNSIANTIVDEYTTSNSDIWLGFDCKWLGLIWLPSIGFGRQVRSLEITRGNVLFDNSDIIKFRDYRLSAKSQGLQVGLNIAYEYSKQNERSILLFAGFTRSFSLRNRWTGSVQIDDISFDWVFGSQLPIVQEVSALTAKYRYRFSQLTVGVRIPIQFDIDLSFGIRMFRSIVSYPDLNGLTWRPLESERMIQLPDSYRRTVYSRELRESKGVMFIGVTYIYDLN